MPIMRPCCCCCDPAENPDTEIAEYAAEDFLTGNITPWGGGAYLKYWGTIPSIYTSSSGRPRGVNFRSGVRGSAGFGSTCRTNYRVPVVFREGAYYYGKREFICRRDGETRWFRFKLYYCSGAKYLTWWITKTDDATAKYPPEEVFSADTSVYVPLLVDAYGTRYKITPQEFDAPEYNEVDIRDRTGDTFVNSGNNPDGLIYAPTRCEITASSLWSGTVQYYNYGRTSVIVARGLSDLSKLRVTGPTTVSLTANYGPGQWGDFTTANTGHDAPYELVLAWYSFIAVDPYFMVQQSVPPNQTIANEGMGLVAFSFRAPRYIDVWGIFLLEDHLGVSDTLTQSQFLATYEHEDGEESPFTIDFYGGLNTFELQTQRSNGTHSNGFPGKSFDLNDLVLSETLTMTVTDVARIFT